MPRTRRFPILALLPFCGACHGSATAPTTTTTTSTAAAYLFTGTLDPGGRATQEYSAAAAGTVTLTLASVSIDAHQPLAQPLMVGFGTPSDGDCVVSSDTRAVPALTAQVSGNVAAGTFCVAVSDPTSQLTATSSFFVRVIVGSPTSQVTESGTSTWTSNLGTNGSVSRSIPTSAGGTITVTLDSLSYASGQLGLGLGLPGAGNSGCALTHIVIGGPSTTISAPADAGEFCTVVYDAGRTTGLVNFSATINHP